MLFNSLGFLYGFLPIAYLVFWRLSGKMSRYVWLAISGYVFYSFWDYRFCALMLFSTGVSYLAGLGLLRWQDPARRRLCVVVPIVTDLALLGFFKYANFVVANINGVSAWAGGRAALTVLDIVLPIGISFYTFHTITYMIAAYRRDITPTTNFFKFAAYVSLFSQLVAGPIVRFRQIQEDFENIDRADRTAGWDKGWSFFVIGMLEKVLIADTIAAVIDPALARYAQLSTVGAWLCVVGFAYQVLLLILNRMIRGVWGRLPLWSRRLGTFGLWVIGCAIFRASGVGMAGTLLGKMFTWHPGATIVGEGTLLAMLVLSAALTHWTLNTFELRHRWSPAWVTGFAVAFGFCLIALYGSRPAPYIYFQF